MAPAPAPAAPAASAAPTGSPAPSAAHLPPALQRVQAIYPGLPLPPQALAAGSPWVPQAIGPVPAGTVLFDMAQPCGGFPLVLAGSVRVSRGAPDGRTLELYRVGPGELCVVSAAALFGHAAMPALGVAVEPTELALLSPEAFVAWTAHEPFRRQVFALFAERLAEVIALAEAVAFQRLDQRLAAALLGHGAVLHTTHQALADELGTVREIVTRLLRRFARDGWVALSRERVELLDVAALRRLAAGEAAQR